MLHLGKKAVWFVLVLYLPFCSSFPSHEEGPLGEEGVEQNKAGGNEGKGDL